MKYKHIFLNPFYLYSGIWTVVLILYSFGWSELYENLDISLSVFFIITIFISLILGLKFSNTLKRKTITYRRPLRSSLFVALIFCGFIAEFIYVGHIPIIDELTNSDFVYKDFKGIPTFHVFLMTFSLFYIVYLFYCINYESDKRIKRSFIFKLIVINILFISLYNRGVIIWEIFMDMLIFLSNRKKIKIRHIVISFIFILIIFYLFGIFGNIRSGSAWSDSTYISDLAKINFLKYPSFLSKSFVWAYVYLISPLGNLNNAVKHYIPSYDFIGIMYSIIPDAITKRIWPDLNGTIVPVIPQLNVSTGFSCIYKFGGIGGMYFLYFVIVLLTFVFERISKNNSAAFVTVQAIHCCVVSFMFFNTMLTYSGLIFSLFFAVSLIAVEKNRKFVPRKDKFKTYFKK